ncbi:MAG: hypothetical protein WDW38_001581 [Sanguina aurantia]
MAPEQLAKEVQQLSWVGHGGYGAVYKGMWQGATVAAKYTVADQVDLQGARAHEAVLSKILSHPNVVQTFASRVAILTEDFLKATFNGDAMYASQTYNSDSGFKSGDGFGNPYGNTTTSIRFADVLTHVGAKPGSVMTQMIMECCDRGSLHSAIAKGLFKTSSKWNNKIALRALLRTAREIAQGMSHLHMSRVVHGDLKPGNVLLMSSRADRRGFIAKVSDFGLSNFCISSHISTSRWSTVAYMSGEAFDGRVTMASDVYSFGVMLWEMYTGTPPHAGLQPAQVVLGVQSGQLALAWPAGSDPRILKLVMSCVVHDPTARPSFKQLINDLASLEAQVRVEASAGPPPPSSTPERQPQPTAISLGMLLGGGGGGPPADPAPSVCRFSAMLLSMLLAAGGFTLRDQAQVVCLQCRVLATKWV